MTRLLGFSVVSLCALGLSLFGGCGSGDESGPIGDSTDASARASSGSGRTTSGSFNDDGTSGGAVDDDSFDDDGSSGSSSGGEDPIFCENTTDCPDGQTCQSNGVDKVCTDSTNPDGKALGESCETDADCASNICTTSKTTGVFYCSAICDQRGADPDCPEVLPLCGDEADAQINPRPDLICRHDV